jgi:hypothetical protein
MGSLNFRRASSPMRVHLQANATTGHPRPLTDNTTGALGQSVGDWIFHLRASLTGIFKTLAGMLRA